MFSWRRPAEELWQNVVLRCRRTPVGMSSSWAQHSRCRTRAVKPPDSGTPGAIRRQKVGDGADERSRFLERCSWPRERAGTVGSREKVPGAAVPCSAASSTPWPSSWPFPPISDCCLGNLLQLFPGIWMCLFSKENKRKTHTVALGRAFLCRGVTWIIELLPLFKNLGASGDCMEHRSSW